ILNSRQTVGSGIHSSGGSSSLPSSSVVSDLARCTCRFDAWRLGCRGGRGRERAAADFTTDLGGSNLGGSGGRATLPSNAATMRRLPHYSEQDPTMRSTDPHARIQRENREIKR